VDLGRWFLGGYRVPDEPAQEAPRDPADEGEGGSKTH
jgi:endogenous inhibitor of DNA gyrase (YacG/DUF329 family)